jgi:hypothetical protein
MATRSRTFRFRDIKFVDRSTMREVGNTIAVRIVNRTLSGKDENNRRFIPYSERYRRRKKTYGRTDVVDLHESGDMLNDLGPTEVTDAKVRVGFTDPDMEYLAKCHDQGRGNNPERRFMGIPEAWVRDIVAMIKERIKT